ncbi:MAG TPA: radical SAM family heme chaperone HemW [Thermoanaerobaculia bacterium]|nr:radical SAM family heme chaperone HemW [Thermoanaerobaculia bacterium]
MNVPPTASFRPAGAVGDAGEPAGLYVHVPFCSAICPYCDFAVSRARSDDVERFVEALLREVGSWRAPGVTFDTLYLGGGTPSLLAPEALERLLMSLGRRFELAPDALLVLEANPEDVAPAAAAAWRALGVRTLSLGVQSFDDADLRMLGRRHRRAQALRAVETAVAAGFDVVSVDLIYALPDRSLAAWRRTLEMVVSLGVRHLSCYELTVHQGTPYWRWQQRGGLRLPGEPERAEWFLATHRALAELGWEGYEVSNFAAGPRHRSRHNQKYWRHAPYLGLGPSAHSFDGARRWWNRRGFADWAGALASGEPAVAGEEHLDRGALALEMLLLGLRTSDGVDLERYRSVAGEDLLLARGDEVERLADAGLIGVGHGWLRPTLEGMAVAESLALRLSGP